MDGSSDISQVARAAFDARRSGSGLDLLLDVEADEALALQFEVARCFVEEGDLIGGWKVGMTSGPARDATGEWFRPFGYVLRSRIFRSGAEVPFKLEVGGAIEPEICVVLGEPLQGANVTPAIRHERRPGEWHPPSSFWRSGSRRAAQVPAGSS